MKDLSKWILIGLGLAFASIMMQHSSEALKDTKLSKRVEKTLRY